MTTYIEPFLGGGAVALSLLPSSPKPFLRWPGGKRKLAADVVSMLGVIDNPGRLVLADVNAPLITLWQVVRDSPSQLIAELLGHALAWTGGKEVADAESGAAGHDRDERRERSQVGERVR